METASITSGLQNDEQIIVLKIAEAIGLNAAEMIWGQASLCGNKLDCGPIKTGHTTAFGCTLIWETNRMSIKCMKTENLPLKVDMYSIKNYQGNINEAVKEHIGYILLPVRGIPMIPVQKALKMKCRWMKFIGLSKEWRPHKPELLLNAMITERSFLKLDRNKTVEATKGLELHKDSAMIFEENPNPCMMTSQKGIFVRLLQKEGLLQVGNIDTECDVFNVRILIQNIKFLDNVPSSNLENNLSSREYFINYILLGNNHSRKLDKKFNRTHEIQEKISINFRSSLKSLHEYFEHIFYIPIEVFQDDKMIGSTEIRFDKIINNFDLSEFLEKFPKGLKCDEKINIKTNVDVANPPILEYKVGILYKSTRKLHQLEIGDVSKIEEPIDEQAGGDSVFEKDDKIIREGLNVEIPHSESEKSVDAKITSVGISKQKSDNSKENLPKLTPKNSHTDIQSILDIHESGKMSEIPRLFSYNLQLKSMKFNKRPIKGIWQISFFHEMADTTRTIINRDISDSEINGNSITFNDLELKLYFTSQSDNIMDLIKSSTCTLCVRTHNTHAKAHLDCRNLLISNKEKTCGNILLTNQSETVSILAEIFVYLDDAGLNFNAKNVQTEFNEDPSGANKISAMEAQKEMLFDESIAHKMIDELEEWKENQQKNFLIELKCTEGKYLAKLRDEFNTMKASYEEKFMEKNNELKTLTRSLEDAHNSLKEKNLQSARNEEHVTNLKMEMEQNHADKLLMIKEKTKQLEQDYMRELNLKNLKIEELECSNKQLYERISFLTLENCDLKGNIECLEAKFEALKANLVPKEELETVIKEMRLLQEKYDSAMESKNFYKQQWAKAFRDCHKIRRENIYDRKDNLFAVKCDRICDILSDEGSKLNFDKDELDEIKQCLAMDDDY